MQGITMQKIAAEMQNKARELLKNGTVNAVLGWEKGDLPYDPAPAFFQNADDLEHLVYTEFCGSNLSKYLIEKNKTPDNKTSVWKIAVFLKPCDTYSLNQLLSEKRIDREKVYAIGIGCDGMIDLEKLKAKGFKGLLEVSASGKGDELLVKTLYGEGSCAREEVLLERCLACKGKEHMVYDERIGEDLSPKAAVSDRFAQVAELEGKSADERFAFWRSELSKCIRCNACRNSCPACSCLKCIFDNARSGVNAKANVNDFEENMFHIIRAFHVAGRCSDCGECSRVCPEAIPLQLLNRKFIKDINNFYGEFQAGVTAELASPLLCYDQKDPEPNLVSKGGKK